MVIRLADGTTTALDFREMAPLAAHRDMYLDEDGEVIKNLSTLGHLASGVPGSVDGSDPGGVQSSGTNTDESGNVTGI